MPADETFVVTLRRATARSGLEYVWVLTTLTGIMAVALWLGFLVGADPISSTTSISWWIVFFGFMATENWIVHMHFRTEGGSFSFLEIPMILGLLFTDPTLLVPAAVLGTLVIHISKHRPPIKIAFNVGNFALRVTLSWVCLDLIFDGLDPISPTSWIGLMLVSMASSAIELTNIWTVVSLAEGSFKPSNLMKMLVFGAVVTMANTIQGILMALLIVVQPFSLLLLACSTAVLYVAYRSYMAERDQRERVEFLYSSTRALKSSDLAESAAGSLLEEAAAMFRAQVVELHLPAGGVDDELAEDEIGRILTYNRGKLGTRLMTRAERRTLSELTKAAYPPTIVGESGLLSRYVGTRRFRDAMVGALAAGDGRTGLMVVADRLGNVITFTAEDLQLFETLAQHAALALENDQLEQALKQLRSLERELAHQASHDGLTGLANRVLLGRRLEEVLQHAAPDLALIYVDLDDFKVVNDTMGHSAGDAVLVEAAQRLRNCVRPTDVVARLGGDEFAVLLVENGEPDRVATRILTELNRPYEIDDSHAASVGASAGLARWDPSLDAAGLISHADVAMYTAKEMGKGTVAVFQDEMRAKVSARQTLRAQLRTAVSDEQFKVLYQPIVDLRTQQIVAAEALVRWVSPDGLLLPHGFIDEAERSGLIVPIDTFVFSQVLQDIGRIDAAMNRELWVTSNLSMRTLQESDLVARVSSEAAKAGVAPSRLVLEVTETALMHDPAFATEQLNLLRGSGMRVALDDFGTGYSSLSYLQTFPVDILKIAQPFVTDLETGNDTFVKAIIDLGHTLGLDVLAEGIEREATLRHLGRLGCEYGQGYYFARPLGIEALIEAANKPKHERFSVSPSSPALGF